MKKPLSELVKSKKGIIILCIILVCLLLRLLSIYMHNLSLKNQEIEANVSVVQTKIGLYLASHQSLQSLPELQQVFAQELDLYEDTDGSYYLGYKDNSDPSVKIDGFVDLNCTQKARATDSVSCVKLREAP